ncbi:MAG: outer membrane lipoprotein carrier protein LolA [Salinivirgaceae bacterium]|jgi:outer membrane lipoprotein carrier protein|nr:outer membrane lipoprotein carrier protein LolA [Salinivirgaceae bacterium]
MKLILTWITLAFFALSVNAQQDPKAKEILDELSEATKAHSTLKVKFTSKAVNKGADMEELYKGELWQKGDKYRLDFMDAITFFDGTTKWVYMPDVQEVNVFSVDDGEESGDIFDNPQKIFTIYEDGFKYRYDSQSEFNGEQVHVIELVPEDKDQEYFKIKIYVSLAKTAINGFKYFAKDGTRITVTIDEFKPNVPMKEAMFTFDETQYPEADVIDMRM